MPVAWKGLDMAAPVRISLGPAGERGQPPATARTLILAPTALIVAAAVMPSDWWHVLGLLTTLLLVPWILLFPTDHSNQD